MATITTEDAQDSVLSNDDWRQLLRWNRPLPESVETCIDCEIQKHVHSNPCKIAISTSEGDTTYGELEQLANGLACLLRECGIRQESIVPLCFSKSKWMIIAMLAVLKAGGAFLALDPKDPPARRQYMLSQSSATVIVSAPEHATLFEGIDARLLELPETANLESNDINGCLGNTNGELPPGDPRGAAYVIFTSGSTGNPKGVIIEHMSFCSGLRIHAPAQYISSSSRVLQFAAYTHDTSIVEILTTLCVGGTICSPSEHERMQSLCEFINQKAVTWAVLTPSFITAIRPEDVPTLEVVVLAGERLIQSNIEVWSQSVRLLSGYGVSECSVITTISCPADINRRASNIGTPAGGVCWIVDPKDSDRLMPIGQVGEILVEGPTVGRGYINSPTATQQSFIRSPKWLLPLVRDVERESYRVYRTGDLGVQNPDGSIDFISRKDSQVKVLGRRTELGEIEHCIAAQRDVRLCAVVYPAEGRYARCLVALVELHSFANQADETEFQKEKTSRDTSIELLSEDTGHIAQKVRQELPTYMAPSVWLVTRRLPRLPSAKLDRRTISNWLASIPASSIDDNEYPAIPHGDDTACQVALLVGFISQFSTCAGKNTKQNDVLHENARDIPFRQQGIDSIKAITLMRAIYHQFDVKLPVESLLEDAACPTSVSKWIREAKESNKTNYLPNSVDFAAEFEDAKCDLATQVQAAPSRAQSPSQNGIKHVFLTGATGFLGLAIMHRLLTIQSDVKISVLVRGSSAAGALQRIQDRAAAEGWWSQAFGDRIEIWLGDLALPWLGLDDVKRRRLAGLGDSADQIDAIIHNGAQVNWSQGAKALWPVNVGATQLLLEYAFQSPFTSRFVYISGGIRVTDCTAIEQQVSGAPEGYSQTKLFSQALVQDAARLASEKWKCKCLDLSVIKPAFIIDDAERAESNTRDYLWRYIASVAAMGVYDASTIDAHVALSTVTMVAGQIVARLEDMPATNFGMLQMECGLSEGTIWDITSSVLRRRLEPVDHETWSTRLKEFLDTYGEAAPLWPLQVTLVGQDYRLGSMLAVGEAKKTARAEVSLRLRRAMEKNIRHLLGAIDDIPAATESLVSHVTGHFS
ncbi:uncharacterized protein N7482_001575 [Penicillium canariense]|uniref:Carrier domain-containing protein n=1 Tax=Penicillium canariense TaxID=189055 RepID=A0A9W9LT29_9EURO|nr:uncharacterized protein N7482_001575 [Penicillium canariense]KAJ5175698.1 hypothetical protein N7482_001575 [Penicillium canariense]